MKLCHVCRNRKCAIRQKWTGSYNQGKGTKIWCMACTHYTAGKNIIHCWKTTYDCLSDNFAVMMRERLEAEGKCFILCLNC